MRLLNTEIMAEPLNWVTVFVMCLFGAALLAIVFPEPSQTPV
jgi:hypothetical protein